MAKKKEERTKGGAAMSEANEELRHYKRAKGVFSCPSCKAARHHFIKSDETPNALFVCAECGHEFRAMTPDEAHQRDLERWRAYHAAHRDEINRKKRQYRAEHLDEVREKERLYRARNRERYNERNRAWYAAHIEQERERKRKYWAEHGKDINVRKALKKLYSGKWGAK